MKKIWYVYAMSLIAALGGLLFGFDTAVISGAEKTIQRLFNLNGFWHGFTISIALIATLLGVLVAGKPADILGRKKVLFIVAIFFGAAAIGSALSHNWFSFLFFRFIVGLAVGASSVIASKWVAIFLIGLAAAGHQSWSINGYTLVSDVFPKKAIASVIGIGKMVGVAVAIVADIALGAVLDTANNTGYFWAFVIAGSSYLLLLGFVHLLMPRMTPLDDNLNYISG